MPDRRWELGLQYNSTSLYTKTTFICSVSAKFNMLNNLCGSWTQWNVRIVKIKRSDD